MAGIAFNRSSVHVGHAIAHAIGVLAHIHHGAACALALPLVLREKCKALPEKMKKLAAILGVDGVDALSAEELGKRLAEKMEAFTAQFGITSFAEYNVSAEQVETALAYISQDPVAQVSAQPISVDTIREYLNSKLH